MTCVWPVISSPAVQVNLCDLPCSLSPARRSLAYILSFCNGTEGHLTFSRLPFLTRQNELPHSEPEPSTKPLITAPCLWPAFCLLWHRIPQTIDMYPFVLPETREFWVNFKWIVAFSYHRCISLSELHKTSHFCEVRITKHLANVAFLGSSCQTHLFPFVRRVWYMVEF